jgi:hypothetical protein
MNWAKKPRPLPAHSMKQITERDGSLRRSSEVSSSGRSTAFPSTLSRQVLASRTGVGWWFRTKKWLGGVR